jgi:hypothetical protein
MYERRDRKSLVGIGAYAHRRANGSLEIMDLRNTKTPWHDEAGMIALFVSRQEAEEAAIEQQEEGDTPSMDRLHVDYVEAAALWEAVSHADIVTVECADDAKLLWLTTRGARILASYGEAGIEGTSESIIQALITLSQ